jgi:predicted SAM-dependent methyltransferase
MIKPLAKSVLQAVGGYQRASRVWMWTEPRLTRSVRFVSRRDGRLVRRYLARPGVHGLHIGAGDNHLDGWLNTELCPRADQIFLDATRPFPLPAAAFDYVYSEHMIEHIPYAAAVGMVRECHRILKPGGVIRIVTPDLRFLTRLLEAETPEVRAYLAYAHAAHRIDGPPGSAVHAVNHFVRAWGHQFIYDAASLMALLAAAGFMEVATRELDASAHAPLRGLAKTDRMPAGFLAMESLTVEAQRAAR